MVSWQPSALKANTDSIQFSHKNLVYSFRKVLLLYFMRKETILTGLSLHHHPSNCQTSAVVIYPRSFWAIGFLYNLKYKQKHHQTLRERGGDITIALKSIQPKTKHKDPRHKAARKSLGDRPSPDMKSA